MAGARSLTPKEEKLLIRHIRRIGGRNRAIVSAGLFLGLRVSEVLSLTIGQVADEHGQIRSRVGIRPRCLKGGYGNTRWIPICPELARALSAYLALRSKKEVLRPDAPLFLSREAAADGAQKALSRSGAEKLISGILRHIGQGDLETLTSHTCRKTWARSLYENSNHNIVLVRDGLGHSSISVTQAYISGNQQQLDELILKCDKSRRPRKAAAPAPVIVPPVAALASPSITPAAAHKLEAVALVKGGSHSDFLPGLESSAA
jgi:integrase